MYPVWLVIVLDILGAIIRLIGLAAFGVAAGWLTLEFFRKAQQAWQLQGAIFLGFVGLGIAMACFLSPAALGAFGIGIGVAIFIWGLPKKGKKEEPD
jgi:hypothetical protein